jgi:uncharacterized membrane protein
MTSVITPMLTPQMMILLVAFVSSVLPWAVPLGRWLAAVATPDAGFDAAQMPRQHRLSAR